VTLPTIPVARNAAHGFGGGVNATRARRAI
jgi:hypothetical protein